MRKLTIPFLLAGLFVFQYCSTAKKAQKEPAKITYEANVQSIITNNCAPCHIPPNGKRELLNTYDAAKSHIDEIITRIQKKPGEKGFMPFKHEKLSDSTIQVFVQWRTDGLLEK